MALDGSGHEQRKDVSISCCSALFYPWFPAFFFFLAVDPIPLSVFLFYPPCLHQIESFAFTGFVGFFLHR